MEYPGLFEEFAKWHLENSPYSNWDSPQRWHVRYIKDDYRDFLERTRPDCYFTTAGRGLVPYPEHLIAMRDMSLI